MFPALSILNMKLITANRALLWQMNAEIEVQGMIAFDTSIFSLFELVYKLQMFSGSCS